MNHLFKIGLVVLCLSGCLWKTTQTYFQEARIAVQNIRQLDFYQQVQAQKIPLEEFQRKTSQLNNIQGDIQGIVYQYFGHLKPSDDYQALYHQLETNDDSLTYHWPSRQILIPDHLEKEMIVRLFPKALTHALQDQNFSIGNVFKMLRQTGQSDRRLALHFLTQGEALLIERWSEHLQGQDPGERLKYHMQQNTHLMKSPEIIWGPEKWMPQGEAVSVIRYVVERKGWKGVNRIYRHPRISTEWFLHPEKLLSLADVPVNISPQALPFAAHGWKIKASDVLGEYRLLLLFKEYLPEADARLAASGWQGDRYQLYQDWKNRRVLIWKIQMDSDADLTELRIALEKISDNITRRFPEGTYIRKLKRTPRSLLLFAGDPEGVELYFDK